MTGRRMSSRQSGCVLFQGWLEVRDVGSSAGVSPVSALGTSALILLRRVSSSTSARPPRQRPFEEPNGSGSKSGSAKDVACQRAALQVSRPLRHTPRLQNGWREPCRDEELLQSEDGSWYRVDTPATQMRQYPEHAVDWWNRERYQYGAKSPMVRGWLRDSNNYRFEHGLSIPRAAEPLQLDLEAHCKGII